VHLLNKLLAFAAFGNFVEVVFCAFTNTLEQLYFGQPIDFTLPITTIYFWMISIYGLSYCPINASYNKVSQLT